MTEISARRNTIAYKLFQLGDLRKATLTGTRPDNLVVDTNLEHSACAGNQPKLTDLASKSG